MRIGSETADALFPKILEVELTRRCNLACRMCQRSVVRSLGQEKRLTSELLAEVLHQCGSWRPQINLGGLGESLLHPELPELLAQIKSAGKRFRTGFNTNGVLLTEECWPWLLDGRVDFLSISLDAPSASSYEWLIGSDEYERVTENARRFLERKGKGKGPLTTVHTFDLPAFAEANVDFHRRWSPLADFVQERSLGNWAGTIDLDAFGAEDDCGGVCERPWVSLAVGLDGGYHRCCASFQIVKAEHSIFDEPIAQYWRGEVMGCLRAAMLGGCLEGSICQSCSGRSIPPNSLLEQASYAVGAEPEVRA